MRKSDCTAEQWEAYVQYAKEWYEKNGEAEREKRRGRSGTEQARAKRRAYDMRPDVKAKRQAREKRGHKQRWAKIKADPRALEKKYAEMRAHRTGMDARTYDALLLLQGNACAICRGAFETSRKGSRQTKGSRYPCADHCHDKSKPRGLLCNYCNAIEGLLKATGLHAQDFCSRLHNYLSNPPADQLNH